MTENFDEPTSDRTHKESQPSSNIPWLISGMVIIGFILLIGYRWSANTEKPLSPPVSEIATSVPPAPLLPLPALGPVDASTQPPTILSEAADLPTLMQRGSVVAADFPNINLPIEVKNFSLEWIKTSILIENQLPPNNAVRVEEILNSYPLRLNGLAAVAGSPEKTKHLATLSTETLPCPWKPSATLALISLRGNPELDCEIKLSFHSNPENIFRYRLLGFAPTKDSKTTALPTRLPAKSTTLIALEIEPNRPGQPLGNLEWSVNNIPAPAIQLSHNLDTEPSDDARFAALVCSFAQWLAGDQTGVLDAEIVAALAREISSSTISADRADFLNLIDRAIHF